METLQGFERHGAQQIICADCMDALSRIPEKSVDLIFADPPYNIQRIRQQNVEWDTFASDEDYIQFMREWIRSATRCAKDNATLLLWHSEMPKIGKILQMMESEGEWGYASTAIWWKRDYIRQGQCNVANRSWFNCCEYLLHFVRTGSDCGNGRMQRDNAAGAKIVDFLQAEMQRLGLSKKDFLRKYKEEYPDASGAMYSHWFTTNQFALPTREVWQRVFAPLGFGGGGGYDALRTEYGTLRVEYDALRKEYENARAYFDNSAGNTFGNVYSTRIAVYCDGAQYHPCQKPQEILRDVICKTCREDGIILDPFAGSFSVACAAHATGRESISIEREAAYFETGRERLKLAQAQLTLEGIL